MAQFECPRVKHPLLSLTLRAVPPEVKADEDAHGGGGICRSAATIPFSQATCRNGNFSIKSKMTLPISLLSVSETSLK